MPLYFEQHTSGLYLPLKGRLLSTSPPVFTPSSITPWVWYDPSDLTTLWQDTGRTTPVTTAGQAVACMDNKGAGGSTYNALQATGSLRPLYQSSGGLSWLEFDGVDDQLEVASGAWNRTTYDAIVAARFISTSSSAGTSNIYGNDAILGDWGGGYFGMGVAETTNNRIDAFFWDGGETILQPGQTMTINGTDFVHAVRHLGTTTVTGQLSYYGAMGTEQTATLLGDGVIDGAGGYLLLGGQTTGAGSRANCRLYGFIGKKADIGATDRLNCRVWLGNKAGFVIT